MGGLSICNHTQLPTATHDDDDTAVVTDEETYETHYVCCVDLIYMLGQSKVHMLVLLPTRNIQLSVRLLPVMVSPMILYHS